MVSVAKNPRGRPILLLSTAVACIAGMNLPAARAAPGDVYNLGTLDGGLYSYGWAINDAGQVVGESGTSPEVPHAFRYTGLPGSGGVMADLGTLGGTNHSVGLAINNAGQVAGRSYYTTGGLSHAFRYTGTPGAGGVMADLGTLGGTQSEAWGINDAGQVVGNAFTTGDAAQRAFRYTGTPGAGGVMADLGTLGGVHSNALDIDDDGFAVGSAQRADNGTFWATLWQTDAANTAVDLDAWLDAVNPILGARWTLGTATGISNNGLITGIGSYNDGPGGLPDGQYAFILDASSLVPEPGSLALAGLFMPALLLRRSYGARRPA